MQPRQKQGSTHLRKKSCLPCAKSKVRCNLERPSCSRCVATNRTCEYPIRAEDSSTPASSRDSRRSVPLSRGTTAPAQNTATPPSLPNILTGLADTTILGPTPGDQTEEQPLLEQPLSAPPYQSPSLDFSNLDIVPFANADNIKDRSLRPFLAVEEQVPKAFHPFTLQYITCILRTYVRQIAGKCVPPIIHPMQVSGGITSIALANCYSLVQLWHHHEAGSEAMVSETIQREMDRLASHVRIHLVMPANNGLTRLRKQIPTSKSSAHSRRISSTLSCLFSFLSMDISLTTMQQ